MVQDWIEACELPEAALLAQYTETEGCYTDCFTTGVADRVTLAEVVAAFYTTPLFKAERVVLRVAAAATTTDDQAHELAVGKRDTFAVWTVEGRGQDQLLMRDTHWHTRSWFQVESEGAGTRLYFGSAVTRADGLGVRTLMPLHRLYARALLSAAVSRLG